MAIRSITRPKKAEHCVSLGWFCSVAMELERIGLRGGSLPFDWVLISMKDVVELIENHFEDYIADEMTRFVGNPKVYKNERYQVDFFHDFTADMPFREQVPAVREKYRRRIERFYQTIGEPTLFLHYVRDQADAAYIAAHCDAVLKLLTSFNPQNDIIFIKSVPDSLGEGEGKSYTVPADDGDVVARKFLTNRALKRRLIRSFPLKRRARNLCWYYGKIIRRKLHNLAGRF